MKLPLLDHHLDDKNFDEKIEIFKMNNGAKAFNDNMMHDLSKFTRMGSINSDWKTEFMKNAEIYLMKDDLENLFAIYHPNSLQDTHLENTNKASKSEKKEDTEDFDFFKSSCSSSSCNNFELSEDSNHTKCPETSSSKTSEDFCNQILPKKLRGCTKYQVVAVIVLTVVVLKRIQIPQKVNLLVLRNTDVFMRVLVLLTPKKIHEILYF